MIVAQLLEPNVVSHLEGAVCGIYAYGKRPDSDGYADG